MSTLTERDSSVAMPRTDTRVLAGLIGLACTGAGPLVAAQRTPRHSTRAETLEVSASSQDTVHTLLSFGEPESCHLESPLYHWRNVGWGSNMNQLLILWVDSVIGGRQQCALDVTPACLQQIRCPRGAPDGSDIAGWRCMFEPMPGLCTFHTDEELEEYEIASPHMSTGRAKKPRQRSKANEKTTAVAAELVEFMYSYTQPWFEEDIEAILEEPNITSLRNGRFVAIHVRRGDKLKHEATKVEVWVYLQAAALYVWQSSRDHSGVESITGVWVSSDDSSVLPEVQELASSYFPNVQTDNIITISFRDAGPEHPNETKDELSTKAFEMTYELHVGLHAELRMMSEAEVFVGTFTSNIARFVYLMRESNGLPRRSTISVDEREWHLH